MNRRDFLKGMMVSATGLLVPAISYPVDPKAIIPTQSRPMNSLGYIRLHFFEGDDVQFIVDESWVSIERTLGGFSISFRSVQYQADRNCVITDVSVLSVGGDVIRSMKTQREIYLGPEDTANLSICLYVDFG